MFCENVEIDGLLSDSKYVFQYCRNVELRDAHIVTKDSFWECENIKAPANCVIEVRKA